MTTFSDKKGHDNKYPMERSQMKGYLASWKRRGHPVHSKKKKGDNWIQNNYRPLFRLLFRNQAVWKFFLSFE